MNIFKKPKKHENLHTYGWELFPQADHFLLQKIESFLENNSFAKLLAFRIEQETSTRFIDWIDHIVFPEQSVRKEDVEKTGFQETKHIESSRDKKIFVHSGAVFPAVLLTKRCHTEIALKPERLDHFVQAMGGGISIQGELYSPYRKATISSQNDCVLSAVERRGFRGFQVHEKAEDILEYRKALEWFVCRQRYFETLDEGMESIQKLIVLGSEKLSAARVTDAFFRAERFYWEKRNWVGQIQKARQDRFGLGWGNHDHHTYRSSRENFSRLLKIFEALGFLLRERFYAGEEAGWGAQILEHPQCNIVLFTDVDLSKEEKNVDFSRLERKPVDCAGTVGMWVNLHGESVFQAGLHHLAARFDFERLRRDLQALNITTMQPFSYFDFLKQAFTKGEMWKVETKKLDSLTENGLISTEQCAQFERDGAVGSHLENLQRTQGFKGFNQRSVSVIIKATDPRTYNE
ncbi:MAG: hypothetical protein MRJ65_07245 [Candidatus Brocadiaceae bacterium]|nr:hypothetical protein [Candidatus Brocadiaceae bacterium]